MFGSGKGGGANGAAQKPSLLTAMRIQSSVEGELMKVLAGTNRLKLTLLGDWDFKAIAHTETQQVGGKGFGGGGQAMSQTTYTYQSAVLGFLCLCPKDLPLDALGEIWGTQGKTGSQQATEEYVLAGVTQAVVQAANYTQDRGVSVSTAVEHDYLDYGDPDGDGHISFTDWVPMKKVTGSPAAGEYKQVGGTYTFNAADIGKTVRISYSYNIPAADNQPTQPPVLKNFTLLKGTRPQTPWSYLTSKHPADARNYAGLALAANDKTDLGSSGTLENYSFEAISSSRIGGGNMDAAIDTILHIVLDDPHTGCGVPSSMLDDLSQARAATMAGGLFFSPVFGQSQSTAADELHPILDAANLAAVRRGKKWAFIPYGERTLAGWGEIYTPDTAPLIDLTEDDFIAEEGEQPIRVERKSALERKNIITIEFLDRANDYNPRPIAHQDAASVFQFGKQPEDKRTCHFICEADVAARVANHRCLRSVHVGDTYHFTLPAAGFSDLLETMEKVRVPRKFINGDPSDTEMVAVRINDIEEDPETGHLNFACENAPFGTATATLYGRQAPDGFSGSADADPGNVNAPIIFEATDRLSLSGGYELLFGLCGSDPNWGGCIIWASDTGDSFKVAGEQAGKARMGVLMADLAATADPDTTGTLDVDLAQSLGELLSGTDDDRDDFRTLCWIEGTAGQYELISYKTATLVSGNRYQLTSLRRGVFGTPVLAHTTGQKFLRLDQAVCVIGFEPQDVGKTGHFKFASYNVWRRRIQSTADLDEYTYAITGRLHNFFKFVANDCTVDSIGTGGPPFTAATVRCYGKTAGVPTVGADINFKKDDGITQTHSAASFAGKALSTRYWALLSPVDWAIYLLTSYAQVVTAMGYGHIVLGDTITPDAAGAGGSSGGGGGGFGGGGGGGGGAGGNLN
ncbi:MAG: phage tail protein [Acidobacteriota bacterium]|nr:phage tail protein [Acidobacteriota bacterium]